MIMATFIDGNTSSFWSMPASVRLFNPLHRREHLEQTVLSAVENVVVWGAGKTGRRWIRWLRNKGFKLAVVDPFQVGKLCQDHAVLGAQALCQLPVDLLLVAVAARGAREEIRADIQRLRPDLVEGTDWLFVA